LPREGGLEYRRLLHAPSPRSASASVIPSQRVQYAPMTSHRGRTAPHKRHSLILVSSAVCLYGQAQLRVRLSLPEFQKNCLRPSVDCAILELSKGAF
jgi:hypothetical protein